jgi:phosphoribosyl 1,2-cyclic phosphodiesterase
MRFASLGSGSEGNALIVEQAAGGAPCRVMLDCGFTLKESERRLARLGLAPETLSAIVVTHEHGDHLSGVFKLARRYGIPVWATHGTVQEAQPNELDGVTLHYCVPGRVFAIGAIEVSPFAVPHDAREPVQYVFSDGARRLAVLTDAGSPTPHIVGMLGGCHALVLECNHDRELLRTSNYPPSLKHRIGGAYGHLANELAAEILARIDRSVLGAVIAAHLSRNNNTPALAQAALASVLGCTPHEVRVADQDQGLDWTPV